MTWEADMVRRIPKWLARAPIPLFKAGLGRLAGGRMLMLEHRGRRTGQLRLVVLEVVGRGADTVDVVSGYGGRAQWFRNVTADPRVRVWAAGLRAVPAVAAVLPGLEAGVV